MHAHTDAHYIYNKIIIHNVPTIHCTGTHPEAYISYADINLHHDRWHINVTSLSEILLVSPVAILIMHESLKLFAIEAGYIFPPDLK